MNIINSIIDEMKNIKHEEEDDESEGSFLESTEYINKIYLHLEENNNQLYIHSTDGEDSFKYKWPGTVKDFKKLETVFKKLSDVEIVPILILSLFNRSSVGKKE